MPNDRQTLRRLRARIDRETPLVRRQVERALASLQHDVTLADLERLLSARDAFGLHDLAALLPRRLQPAVATLARVFLAGAGSGVETLRTAGIALRFDAASPQGAAAARAAGAEFVTGVTTETKAAIRAVVAQSFEAGVTVPETARLLQPLIGLTERQATAVMGGFLEDVEAGVARAAALASANAYADTLLAKRALLIARTEIIRASTGGEIAAWQQAQRQGLLSWGAEKVWIVTDDDKLCPFCRAMNNQQAHVGSAFHSPLGGTVPGPPLHPACRCAVGIASARKAA